MQQGIQFEGPCGTTRRLGTLRTTTSDLIKIMVLLTIVGLQTAQQVRLLRFCLLMCLLVAVEHKVVVAMKKATTRDSEKNKMHPDVAERHARISVPHIHAWSAPLNG
jgi:hypothetical protein